MGSGSLGEDFSRNSIDRMKECFKRGAGFWLAHEQFADEESVKAGFAQLLNVSGGLDAAFRNAHGVGRELCGKFERGLKADLKGLQVTIVHATDVAADVLHEFSFFGSVDFAEDIEPVAILGDEGEVVEVAEAQRAGDEQDGIGVMGAGFSDLVLVDDEVFAKAGNAGGS